MSSQKSGLDYFFLDVNIEQDDKIALIQSKYGIEGFATIIKIFIKIYSDKGYFYEWTEDTSLLFSGRAGINHDRVIKIVEDAIKWGIFNKDKFNKYQILTSKRIQKTYLDATKRRKNTEIIEAFLLLNKQDVNILNGNVYILQGNVDILGQSRVEKSIIEKSRVDNIAPTSEAEPEPELLKPLKIKIKFNREKWEFENITTKDVEIWQEAYPAANLEIEFNKMIAWIKEAGAKGHKSNWGRFINGWLKRCQDRGGTK